MALPAPSVDNYLKILYPSIELRQEIFPQENDQRIDVYWVASVDPSDAVSHGDDVKLADQRSPADVLRVGSFAPVQGCMPRPLPLLRRLAIRDQRTRLCDDTAAFNLIFVYGKKQRG